MSLNYKTNKTWYQFDSSDMVTVKGDENSWRDSIGWTVLAWLSTGKPKRLEAALDKCLFHRNGKWYLFRHPKRSVLSSRDHWSYFLIYRKLRTTAEGIPMKLSFKHIAKQSPSKRGMRLWIKAISGNRRAERWYYRIYIPGAILGLGWYRLVRKLCDFHGECFANLWDKVGTDIQKSMSQRQRIGRKIIMRTIPPYALQVRAWQLFVMPESENLKRLKMILVKRTGKFNYLLRLLFDDPGVTKFQVYNYRQMTGDRFGVNLDESNDRDTIYCTEDEREFNNFEELILQYVWNVKKN